MRLQIYFFVFQFAIFCNLYYVTKALVGINVRNAKKNEYPFVASIMQVIHRNNKRIENHFCTGALISASNILSTDYCATHEIMSRVQVKIGSVNLKYGPIYGVMWWTTYQQWSTYKNKNTKFQINDIAVIRLTHTVNGITPAFLSTTSTYGFYGLNVVAVGWGKTNNQETPTIMKVADLKVITNANCETRIEKLEEKTNASPLRYLCTNGEPFALLECGDSGGPLIYNGVIIGINTSTCPLSKKQNLPDKVNLHLVIDHYIEFINDVKNNS